jgi:hypothetical protein
MMGGDRILGTMLGAHVALTPMRYSVFSAAVDVMFASALTQNTKVCVFSPDPCDTRYFGSALVSSGVLTIGDHAAWHLPLIRLGIGHYHAKWKGAREGAPAEPEPSGIMFSGGVAARIPGLRPHVEAELSLRGFDRLEVGLTSAVALRFSYRF